VGGRSAQNLSSHALRLVKPSADVSDLLRRKRRDRKWTQQQLADFCGVRTQTVSAWERGNSPQRRFFAKIADFLGLPDEETVEALLPGSPVSTAEPAAEKHDPPPVPTTELQARVIDAVVSQVAEGRKPSPDLIRLLNQLLAAAGLPGNSVLFGAGPGDLDHDERGGSGR
jgi:transcriptional regulator with XRE-family HTH domain